MKKTLILLLALTVFTNCKNDKEEVKPLTDGKVFPKTEKQNDGLTTLGGEFSFYKDAAVLQVGNSSIYGVVLNDKMRELYKMGEQFRTEPTDGVMVQVRGKIIPKTGDKEGWPYSIDIKEIINVKALTVKNEVIKIGN